MYCFAYSFLSTTFVIVIRLFWYPSLIKAKPAQKIVKMSDKDCRWTVTWSDGAVRSVETSTNPCGDSGETSLLTSSFPLSRKLVDGLMSAMPAGNDGGVALGHDELQKLTREYRNAVL